MVAELPSDEDFLFDAAGWVKNPQTRRYELEVLGEVVAAIAYEEVKLHLALEGSDYVDLLIAQGEGIRENLLDKARSAGGINSQS